MTIDKDTRISQSEGLAERLFEGMMLVITAQDSMLHRFDTMGTWIWEQLAQPISFQALLTRVQQTFEDIDATVDQDLADFLHTLEKKKLIVLQEVDHIRQPESARNQQGT